ncbi:Protein phosphatase 2C family protein [Leishmania donovani]|uniref:protein-serine/threonine phosphatase n=1 Tax=Leishmania donovani TaxID=5661 RepID=A0A504Y9E8_LEIDO|nr:Protein phosphatase 2C family protein [Leishmania donovani]
MDVKLGTIISRFAFTFPSLYDDGRDGHDAAVSSPEDADAEESCGVAFTSGARCDESRKTAKTTQTGSRSHATRLGAPASPTEKLDITGAYAFVSDGGAASSVSLTASPPPILGRAAARGDRGNSTVAPPQHGVGDRGDGAVRCGTPLHLPDLVQLAAHAWNVELHRGSTGAASHCVLRLPPFALGRTLYRGPVVYVLASGVVRMATHGSVAATELLARRVRDALHEACKPLAVRRAAREELLLMRAVLEDSLSDMLEDEGGEEGRARHLCTAVLKAEAKLPSRGMPLATALAGDTATSSQHGRRAAFGSSSTAARVGSLAHDKAGHGPLTLVSTPLVPSARACKIDFLQAVATPRWDEIAGLRASLFAPASAAPGSEHINSGGGVAKVDRDAEGAPRVSVRRASVNVRGDAPMEWWRWYLGVQADDHGVGGGDGSGVARRGGGATSAAAANSEKPFLANRSGVPRLGPGLSGDASEGGNADARSSNKTTGFWTCAGYTDASPENAAKFVRFLQPLVGHLTAVAQPLMDSGTPSVPAAPARTSTSGNAWVTEASAANFFMESTFIAESTAPYGLESVRMPTDRISSADPALPASMVLGDGNVENPCGSTALTPDSGRGSMSALLEPNVGHSALRYGSSSNKDDRTATKAAPENRKRGVAAAQASAAKRDEAAAAAMEHVTCLIHRTGRVQMTAASELALRQVCAMLLIPFLVATAEVEFSPPNNGDASAGIAGAPLSDELAGAVVTAHKRCGLRAASPTAAPADAIAATSAAGSLAFPLPLSRSTAPQRLDGGAPETPSWRISSEESRGSAQKAEGGNLLELPIRVSSTHEDLDDVSTGVVAPPSPGMFTCAQKKEPAARSQSLDAPLGDALSVIDSPKVGDLARGGVAERADADEHTHIPLFRVLSLPRGLIGDDAAPRTRRAEVWQPAVEGSESKSSIATALASSGRALQETDSDDKDAPPLKLHGLVAPRLSPGDIRSGGRGVEDCGAPAASAASTPLLPLCASVSSGSSVFVSRQLRTEPLSTALTTPTDAAMAASAAARSRSVTSGTPLLDSFRIVLSPCPSSIAPSFSLVPCPTASRALSSVSVSAPIVQQRWRDQVRARTRVGVGSGSGTSPLTSATCALDPVGGHALWIQPPPHPTHAAARSRCGSAGGDGDGDAASVTPLHEGAPPPSRRPGGRGGASEIAAPMPLSFSCLGAAASLSKDGPGVRRGRASPPLCDASLCSGPGSGRDHAATLSLRLSLPQPSCTSLDAAPPPAPQLQQHPGSAHNPPASANATTQSLSRDSPAAHASSPPSLPRQTEPPRSLRPDHGQRDSAGSSGLPPWPSPPVTTAHHHDSGFCTSPTDAGSHSSNGRRLPAQPFVFSASASQRRLQPSAVTDSVTSPSACAEWQSRARLYHESRYFEPLCVPGEAAPMRRSPPLQADSLADLAGRCVADGSTLLAATSLAQTKGEGLVSTCSTPPPSPMVAPPRPSLSLTSQHVPGRTSSVGGEDVCLWNATPDSSRRMALTSTSLPRGSPLARAARASAASSWAPSLCSSPTAMADIGGLGSKGGMALTCGGGRRPHGSAALHASPADGDGLVHFGVESELCGLQRIRDANSSSLTGVSSAVPASTGVVFGGSQRAVPSILRVDSESGGAGSNDLGSFSDYVPSALLLAPLPPLVALPAGQCPSSRASLRSSDSAPPAAVTSTAVTRATASAQYTSPLQWPSPVLCTRERNTVLAAAAATSEALAEGSDVVAALEEGDVQADISAALDASLDVTAAAAEGVTALSPATQFRCAFSSLRGCRSRQEDSVMMVADLPVRVRRSTTAAPTTATAAASPTSTGAASGASARREAGAVREDTEWADADSMPTQEVTATARHATNVRDEVVFACFGVFDGHCGDTVASLASQFFPEHFEHALQAYQRQLEQDPRNGRGASRGTDSSAQRRKGDLGSCNVCPEGPRAERLRGHHETAPMEAVEFQRVVSAALVQALLHLDLTLYDLLHHATHGLSAQRRDAGSTASVATFFKLPTTSAPCHGGARAVVGSCTSCTPPLATGAGDAPSNSGGSAAACTPATLDEPMKQGVPGEASTPLMPAARTEDTYRLCIANLGDSRAIIGNLQTGELLLSTTDHRISAYPSEAARIQAAGGVVELGRVDGSLDVTRGLGDYRYKVAPARWWSSAAPASATAASASVSLTSLAASAVATNAATTATLTAMGRSSSATATATSSSSPVKVVAGSVPPASTPRHSDASEGGSAVRGLRWQSCSSTPLRSPTGDNMDGGAASRANFPRASNARCADGEAKQVPASPSQGPLLSSAAESGAYAHAVQEQRRQQVPSPSPSSPISPPSLFSSWSPLASASTVTLTHNAVSNIADVYEWEVRRGEVLIMASDGVWDRMTSEDVLAFVCHELTAAQQQSKGGATRMMRSDGAAVKASDDAGMGARESPGVGEADAEASNTAEVPLLFLREALERTPLRQPSPFDEQECASARFSPAAPLCTPGGNGAAVCDQHDDEAADSLSSTTGSAPCFFAVQAAARRLTEHVVNNLSGSDNTSAVVITFD